MMLRCDHHHRSPLPRVIQKHFPAFLLAHGVDLRTGGKARGGGKRDSLYLPLYTHTHIIYSRTQLTLSVKLCTQPSRSVRVHAQMHTCPHPCAQSLMLNVKPNTRHTLHSCLFLCVHKRATERAGPKREKVLRELCVGVRFTARSIR